MIDPLAEPRDDMRTLHDDLDVALRAAIGIVTRGPEPAGGNLFTEDLGQRLEAARVVVEAARAKVALCEIGCWPRPKPQNREPLAPRSGWQFDIPPRREDGQTWQPVAAPGPDVGQGRFWNLYWAPVGADHSSVPVDSVPIEDFPFEGDARPEPYDFQALGFFIVLND